MKKKKLALGLVLLLTASLVGCAREEGGAGQTTGQEQTQETTGSNSEGTSKLPEKGAGTAQAGVFPVSEEPITMTAIIQQLPSLTDITLNKLTLWAEEKTNIHFDWTVVPQEGFSDKLNLMLEAGDYPEVIFSGAASNNTAVMKYGMEEKIYIPVEDYIEEYSIDLKERFDEMPELREMMTAPDGHIYVLGCFEGYSGHNALTFKQWVNQDWLTKLGLEIPQTVQEYYEMLLAFRTGDPNGNGKADEIPLSGAANSWDAEPYKFIMNAFGYYDTTLIKLKDRQFTSIADQDYFREGLRFLNRLYKEGLMDPVAMTQDSNQLVQLSNDENDILGCYASGHIGMGIDITNRELFDKWTYLVPLKGENGYRGLPIRESETINGGPFAITDQCTNPAAAIRFADLFYGDFDSTIGQEYYLGVKYAPADPGAKGPTGEDAVFKFIPSYLTEKDVVWGATSVYGDWKGFKKYGQFEGNPKDADNYEGYLIQVTEDLKSYGCEYEQIMPNWFEPETSTMLTNMFTPISDFVNASIVDFITGNKDIETGWDQYLEDLKELGYQDYIAQYSENYFR